MIYMLDHLYDIYHTESAIFIESNKTESEIIDITAALQFLLEDIHDESESLDRQCLLKILVENYGCKDVKKQYESYLPLIDEYMISDEFDWNWINFFDFDNIKITHIDLYLGRENNCGEDHPKIMKKFLPEGEELELLKSLLLEKGKQEFEVPESIKTRIYECQKNYQLIAKHTNEIKSWLRECSMLNDYTLEQIEKTIESNQVSVYDLVKDIEQNHQMYQEGRNT